MDLDDYNNLKRSLEKQRAMTIFEDMKLLFDTTVKELNGKIGGEREHFNKIIDKLYSET